MKLVLSSLFLSLICNLMVNEKQCISEKKHKNFIIGLKDIFKFLNLDVFTMIAYLSSKKLQLVAENGESFFVYDM